MPDTLQDFFDLLLYQPLCRYAHFTGSGGEPAPIRLIFAFGGDIGTPPHPPFATPVLSPACAIAPVFMKFSRAERP
jgi:hypothetical protein